MCPRYQSYIKGAVSPFAQTYCELIKDVANFRNLPGTQVRHCLKVRRSANKAKMSFVESSTVGHALRMYYTSYTL